MPNMLFKSKLPFILEKIYRYMIPLKLHPVNIRNSVLYAISITSGNNKLR